MVKSSLHQSFIEALPDRLRGLEEAFDQWQQTGPSALDEFYRLAHNLAGAGALYGFGQVGSTCRELERYLIVLKTKKATADPELVANVQRMLAEVDKSISQIMCEDEF